MTRAVGMQTFSSQTCHSKRIKASGGTGPSTGMSQFPAMVNAVLGTKFKVVYGYPGGNQVNLALERGEVQARLGWTLKSALSEKPHWFKQGKAIIVLQMGISKNPELKDVPWLNDLVKNPDDLKAVELLSSQMLLGRPYFAPPGVPADRAKILRVAFEKTMTDKGNDRHSNKDKNGKRKGDNNMASHCKTVRHHT